jgi:hypothetical protein
MMDEHMLCPSLTLNMLSSIEYATQYTSDSFTKIGFYSNVMGLRYPMMWHNGMAQSSGI